MNILVELTAEDKHVLGKVSGEIDAFSAPILREKLTDLQLTEGLHIELDLTDVSYMDSTGLGAIVGFYKVVDEKKAHLKLTGLSPRLKRLFEITGLGEIMDIQSASEEVKIDETV